MSLQNILVVSPDYDLAEHVRLSVDARQIEVNAAYSHRDALYSMAHTSYDGLIVDAQMRTLTGEETVSRILADDVHMPVVIYTREQDSSRFTEGAFEGHSRVFVLHSLQAQEVHETLFSALDSGRMARDSRFRATQKTTRLPDTSERSDNFWLSPELKTLFALSRSLSEVLDLTEVLNRVVEAARSLTSAEEGMILLHDSETDDLYLRAKVGIENDVARNFRIRTTDTLAGQVFHSASPLLVGARGPQKVKTEYFVNSLLYVPILFKGKSIGVLGVNNKTKHDIFAERDQELLLNLASYAAIAIENARIHGQSVKRARELKTLVDASEAINASLSFEHTLHAAVEQLRRVLNVDIAELYLWNSASSVLCQAARQISAVWRGVRPALPITPGGLLDTGFRQESLYYCEDALQISAHTASARFACVLPIVIEHQSIGALIGYSVDRPRAATQEQVSRASHLTEEMVQLLIEGRPPANYLLKSVEEVCGLLDMDWCEVGIVSVDKASLQLSLSVGSAVWLQTPSVTLSLEEFPVLDSVLNALVPINIADDTAERSERALLTAMRCRALMALPLVYNGQLRGAAFFADTQRSEQFGEREIDLGRSIANQAVIAIENAHLHRDLSESLRELKDTQNRLVQTARLSAMGELAGAVAHQINNPLTTIVLDTELMLEDPSIDTITRQTLNAILYSGKRAANVTRRLLVAVRPSHNDSIPTTPIEVSATIAETVALVRAHIERKRISLIEINPPNLNVRVLAKPGELDDIWLNLLLNAHDALTGRQDAQMGIEAINHPDKGWIEIRVWDNGTGIPEGIINEIFRPFYTTKPAGEGTGLGLHICHQVVESIGGRISVESRENMGTIFTVFLPVLGEI